MKLAVFSFSKSGKEIAEKIQDRVDHKTVLFDKDSYPEGLKSNMGRMFGEYDGLVFISSVGIALRYIAPFVEDKTTDPGVVVIDDLGRYSIPILSGHLGGANRLAIDLGEKIGAKPIVTTASDGRGIDAVDEFAKRYGLVIESMKDAKTLTAMMVDGKPVSFLSPRGYRLNYPNIDDESPEGVIAVDYRLDQNFDMIHCILRPRVIYLGIGCRRGKSCRELYGFVKDVLEEERISIDSVASIGSIDIKRDELGLIELAEKLGCDFQVFTVEELESVEHKFEKNDFVKSKVGVNSVAESSAELMGDKIIVKKKARDGMTVAISRRNMDG